MSLGLLVAGVLALARTGEGAPSAAPATASASAPAGSALTGDAVAGKATFTQYCSICHGAGAKGFIGPHIAGIDWTAPGLIAIVRGGVGGYGSMPAFNSGAVTDKNIADIAAYLASPAPPSTAKSTTTSQAVAVVAAAAPASTSAPVAGGDALHGRQVYSANCAACHGADAQGGVGPALRGERTRKDTAAAIAWIKNPTLPMPKLYPAVISEKDVEDVAAYVESL
jgi:ubiquinol-cytochrome c reductase cytochrome c subunit